LLELAGFEEENWESESADIAEYNNHREVENKGKLIYAS